jgi:hypothetical protein
MALQRLALFVLLAASSSMAVAAECRLGKLDDFPHKEIGKVPLYRHQPSGAVVFSSIMHVNPDGAPDAYHPDDIGTVHICNGIRVRSTCAQDKPWISDCMADYRKARSEEFSGKTPVCFFAMATRDGVPLVQGNDDPKPGYFISTTHLKQPGEDVRRPAGQIDSNVIPFAVIPKTWLGKSEPGPRIGDMGIAYRRSTGAVSGFVIADSGPENKIGEGSIALLQALGRDPFIMRKGKRRAFSGIGFHAEGKQRKPDVVYVMFPGTAETGLTVTQDRVRARTAALLETLGGVPGLQACAAKL